MLMNDAQQNIKGIAWALLAIGLFSLVYVSGKLTGGIASAIQIIWFRYVSGFIVVILIARFRGMRQQDFETKQLRVHFIRAAAGGGSGVAAIYAAANMPVANATAIGLLDGLFIMLLGVFVLREIVSKWHWIAALLSLVGALIVVFGHGLTFQLESSIFIPACVALVGAVLVAIESVLIKTLARSESVLPVLFYVNLFGMLLFALPAWWYGESISGTYIVIFLGFGLIALIAQACNIFALRLSNITILGPIRYSWIIFSVLLGALFFDEIPRLTTYIGGALILLGGVCVAMSGGHSSTANIRS